MKDRLLSALFQAIVGTVVLLAVLRQKLPARTPRRVKVFNP